jgi:4a-hydroxytetrahydrobiopterin dehydratase
MSAKEITMTVCDLSNKKCVPCEGGVPALSSEQTARLLAQLNQWTASKDGKSIYKKFSFKNFYRSMGFANAIAWIANEQGHHPDLKVGYTYCEVVFTTHAIDGLSENDFICAAKIDQLA